MQAILGICQQRFLLSDVRRLLPGTSMVLLWGSQQEGGSRMTWGWGLVAILLMVGWLIPLAMVFVIPVNRKPSSAVAWLLLLVLLPYLGLLIFLLLGSPRLSR